MAFQRKKPAAIGTKAPYPGFIEPALATSVEKVPSGDRWLHEIKFDGYRVQLHIANDDIKIFTRRGLDWTKRFKKIAADAYLINAGSATAIIAFLGSSRDRPQNAPNTPTAVAESFLANGGGPRPRSISASGRTPSSALSLRSTRRTTRRRSSCMTSGGRGTR